MAGPNLNLGSKLGQQIAVDFEPNADFSVYDSVETANKITELPAGSSPTS